MRGLAVASVMLLGCGRTVAPDPGASDPRPAPPVVATAVPAPPLAATAGPTGTTESTAAAPPPAGAERPAPGGCTRDEDCPLSMAIHQPCCLQPDGTGHCSGLAPKADACPDRHLCVDDADCHGGARCAAEPASGKRTCKGAARPGGRTLPGQCYNRPPNAPPMPECDAPR